MVCDIRATTDRHLCRLSSLSLLAIAFLLGDAKTYRLFTHWLRCLGYLRSGAPELGLGMTKGGILRSLLLASCMGALSGAANAAPFTINDAVRMAVQTNPSIGEAAANKRATEAELRQTQAPCCRKCDWKPMRAPERLNNPATIPLNNITPTLNNGQWVAGAKGSIFIRQLLFDGFTSLHEMWRQTARVDAAAARTHERSELTALDASEAYIDVVRYTRLVALAQENVAAHRRIFSNVHQRFRAVAPDKATSSRPENVLMLPRLR